MNDVIVPRLADSLDVAAAVVDGVPALEFIFGFRGEKADPILLVRKGFSDLPPQMHAAMQAAMALDGYATDVPAPPEKTTNLP